MSSTVTRTGETYQPGRDGQRRRPKALTVGDVRMDDTAAFAAIVAPRIATNIAGVIIGATGGDTLDGDRHGDLCDGWTGTARDPGS